MNLPSNTLFWNNPICHCVDCIMKNKKNKAFYLRKHRKLWNQHLIQKLYQWNTILMIVSINIYTYSSSNQKYLAIWSVIYISYDNWHVIRWEKHNIGVKLEHDYTETLMAKHFHTHKILALYLCIGNIYEMFSRVLETT